MKFEIDLIVLTCCHEKCGIVFAVPAWWEDARRKDHVSWCCPNGHSQSFGESRQEKQIREQAQAALSLQAQLNEANHAMLVAQSDRDKEIRKRRKIERRIAKGVCPCCNRTFEDIARHMATKHKDFTLPPGHQKQIAGSVQ